MGVEGGHRRNGRRVPGGQPRLDEALEQPGKKGRILPEDLDDQHASLRCGNKGAALLRMVFEHTSVVGSPTPASAKT